MPLVVRDEDGRLDVHQMLVAIILSNAVCREQGNVVLDNIEAVLLYIHYSEHIIRDKYSSTRRGRVGERFVRWPQKGPCSPNIVSESVQRNEGIRGGV